jgi:hypothetical protein
MHQQLWGYKVEEKSYLEVREQKRLNTADLDHSQDTWPTALSWSLSEEWMIVNYEPGRVWMAEVVD